MAFNNKITVCLSSYNGSEHLDTLLESLNKQTFRDFLVLMRDDLSCDGTLSLMKNYSNEYSERFRLIHDKRRENLGCARSFWSLLEEVGGDQFFMFCDQDDIWLNNKLSLFWDEANNLMRYKGLSPSDVFAITGDMVVVDNNLNVINRSFWEYQRTDFQAFGDWKKVLVSNPVIGCSTLFSPGALKLLRAHRSAVGLHDHFAAIVTAKHGDIFCLFNPTMLYRQHATNVVGAEELTFTVLARKIFKNPAKIFRMYRDLGRYFGLFFGWIIILKVASIYRRITAHKIGTTPNGGDCG